MNKHNKVAESQPHQAHPYLEYLGTFIELTQIPSAYSQLDNGVTLLQLFQLIKGFTLSGSFQDQPRTFSHKFSNFKLLLNCLQTYWNEHLQSEIDFSEVDIVEIAHYGSVADLEKVLELFVKTAANSENQTFFIQRILQTSCETQEFLRQIVEKAICPPSKESPRKQKEKRMIDRLMELDHENEKLQQIINSICDEKDELQGKLRSNADLLSEKVHEIEQFRSYLSEQACTPQKRRQFNLPDTSDRKDSQIDSLKNQIIEMNAHHEKQIQECLAEMERFSRRAHEVEKVKAELELSQEIIVSNKELMSQAQEMEHTLSQCKAQLMDKENAILVMRQKLQRNQQLFLDMERAEMQVRAELERKNIHLLELATRIERTSPKKADNHHNLYLEFPEIINTEADAFMETNKILREELERARQTVHTLSANLDQANLQLETMGRCDTENKKLRQLLVEEKSYKGEEIDVLVHALYHLRQRVREGSAREQQALKVRNA